MKSMWKHSMMTGKAGMISRTCRNCGRTITLPENVQYWPTYCQECRAKVQPAEMITRACRKCGRNFSFPSGDRQWPKYCPACRDGHT
ncbi:MAG: hypothetical protein ABTA22_04175 [Clostridia bacterium]